MENKTEQNLLLTARVLTVGIPFFLVAGRAAADIALSLVALLFLARSVLLKDWSWTRAPWFRAGLALWIWMLLISNTAFDVASSYGEAVPWIRFLLFAAALEAWVLNEVWMRRLLVMTTVIVAAIALDAWLQYFTGVDLTGNPRQPDNRLTGPFHRPMVGIFLTKLFFPVLLGFVLWRAWERRAIAPRLGMAGIALLTMGAVFVSGERMALILLVMGLMLAAILQKGKARIAALSVLAIALIGAGTVAAIDKQVRERQINSTIETLAKFYDSPYGQLWRSGIQLGSERPLTGVGMKNFRIACSDPSIGLPADIEGRCGTHPHNLYLEWFSEAGLPGLALFIVMITVLGRHLWQAWQRGDSQAWMAGPLIAVILHLWPIAPIGSLLSNNWNGVLMWLVTGWVLAAARLTNRSSPAFGKDQ